MPELTKDVAEALNYFVGESICRNAPASEQMISDAEQRLGLGFSPSMREFLQVHNGLGLIDYQILSVPEDMVQESLHCRTAWEHNEWVAIARDSSGDVYVLLTDKRNERGENPVAKVDHEDGHIMAIVGSSYERFLWFLLDKLQREFEPDGKDKAIWEATEEDEEDEDWEEPSFPWPYQDKEWMQQHDPYLAQWLKQQ
jgi:hypothetical protein